MEACTIFLMQYNERTLFHRIYIQFLYISDALYSMLEFMRPILLKWYFKCCENNKKQY